nr:MAG TPA: hypothetical protein [Caudoviricetes sp.]
MFTLNWRVLQKGAHNCLRVRPIAGIAAFILEILTKRENTLFIRALLRRPAAI